jgi:arylsulfatase A-like enzyme
VEVQDIYLRLDREIEVLLNTLDKKVGEGNYVLFLTSDHGVQPVVSYQLAQNKPAGLAVIPKFNQELNFKLGQTYGAFEWIEYFGLNQIYLDHDLIEEKDLSLAEVRQGVVDFMKEQPGVRFALTPEDLVSSEDSTGLVEMVKNGYFPERSGDVMLVYEYGVMPTSDYRTPISKVQGAGHGSGYDYDTHVPLLWFGKGIPQGTSARKVHPVDIAPTLAKILNLQGSVEMTGKPLPEILK